VKSLILKRSVAVAGHITSVSLEDPFWSALKEIADAQHETLSNIVTEIDRTRQTGSNLSSAIRLFVLDWMRLGIGFTNSEKSVTGRTNHTA
jgi:predicted DNA-binding ribbon-helix-helix protein